MAEDHLERERAVRWLSQHRAGDSFRVGQHLFRIERARGTAIYITKGKGKKLYKLHVVSLNTPFTVEVREVWPGSGDLKQDVKPIARFQPQ